MNKISFALNAVLLVAVGVLFYLYSSLNSKISGTAVATDSTGVKMPKLVMDPTKMTDSRVAYINVDTLNMQYQYIVDKAKEINTKQANLESQYEGMVAKFQQDYEALQQAAQAGIRPEAELQKESTRLQQKQQEIAYKEKQIQNLADEVNKTHMDMLKNVSKFIEKFNNGKYDYILAYSSNISSILYAKPDLEITSEVVKGLNEEYKSTKPTTPGKK